MSGLPQVSINILLPSLDLDSFAENIYNGNLSLKAAKIRQKNMEDMIIKSDKYNPGKEKYNTKNNKYCNASVMQVMQVINKNFTKEKE